MSQVCQSCHAQVKESLKERASESANPWVCPACAGRLVDQPGPNLDPPGAVPRETDRRGILLPRRHAVGGVITPR